MKVVESEGWLDKGNVEELNSFLDSQYFSGHIIADYSKLTLPLTNLCKKATPWNFGEMEATTFRSLKNTFSTAPVLCHWAPDLQMTVETDASDCTIAGILSVTTQDNEIRPVAFFSHSLQGVEKNYDTHDKELLAMFEAFKNWHYFLEVSGKVIDTVTNHKNLEYFMTSKKLSCQQARWAEFLAQFNMRVCFRPGRLGSKPDMLTCRWDLYLDRDGQEPTATNMCPIFDSKHLAEDPVLACTGTVEEPTTTAGITMDSEAINRDIAIIGTGDDFTMKQ